MINASLIIIAVVLMLSENWVSDFHQWVQAKVAEA